MEILVQMAILKFNSSLTITTGEILRNWRSGFGSPEINERLSPDFLLLSSLL